MGWNRLWDFSKEPGPNLWCADDILFAMSQMVIYCNFTGSNLLGELSWSLPPVLSHEESELAIKWSLLVCCSWNLTRKKTSKIWASEILSNRTCSSSLLYRYRRTCAHISSITYAHISILTCAHIIITCAHISIIKTNIISAKCRQYSVIKYPIINSLLLNFLLMSQICRWDKTTSTIPNIC